MFKRYSRCSGFALQSDLDVLQVDFQVGFEIFNALDTSKNQKAGLALTAESHWVGSESFKMIALICSKIRNSEIADRRPNGCNSAVCLLKYKIVYGVT